MHPRVVVGTVSEAAPFSVTVRSAQGRRRSLPAYSPVKKGWAPLADSDRAGSSVRGVNGTAGVSIINPGDIYEYKLFFAMFQALKGLGYQLDHSLRVATYDWRLWGDHCRVRWKIFLNSFKRSTQPRP